jgi:uncharacterized membrane protein YagU involved in acid resistance
MMSIGVIVLAGSVCGVLDLISAAALFKLDGVSFQRLLQFVASGALGESAFSGGKKSAVAGLLFHFSIAFTAAAVYYATSLTLALLLRHALISGILYGVAIHLFMSFVVIPLSRIPKRKFSVGGFLRQLAVHMFVVGPSISLVVRHFS